MLAAIGFAEVQVKERFDAFQRTNKERIARKFGLVGVNVFARKPVPRDTR